MRFVDAHHHLWDLSHCHYPWLMARGVKRFFGDPAPIQQNYLPADLLAESASWIPDKTVHVQVGVEESQSLEESLWLHSLADDPDGPGIPNGIVAYVDLASPDADAHIERQAELSRVRGVRQIVGRHVDEDRVSGTDALISNPAWARGLSALARAELSFDLQLIPQQYEAVQRLLNQLNGLPVAICHCGSPWDQSVEGFSHWRRGMRAFARRPETFLKISGLGMFNPGWRVEDIRPLVLESIEMFSPQRVMFGSNFPVDKLYGTYERIWSTYDQLTRPFSHEERSRMFAGTAEAFYGI